jgi:hypothetical protein
MLPVQLFLGVKCVRSIVFLLESISVLGLPARVMETNKKQDVVSYRRVKHRIGARTWLVVNRVQLSSNIVSYLVSKESQKRECAINHEALTGCVDLGSSMHVCIQGGRLRRGVMYVCGKYQR